MHLTKRIPVAGRIGWRIVECGGRVDRLIEVVGTGCCRSKTCQAIAAELGSDVPFFLHGGTAIGTGRGNEIEPIPDVDAKYLLIVTPGVRVSTPMLSAGLDAPNLTIEAAESYSYCLPKRGRIA